MSRINSDVSKLGNTDQAIQFPAQTLALGQSYFDRLNDCVISVRKTLVTMCACVAIAAGLAAACGTASAQSVDLALAPAEGESFKLVYEHTTNQTTEVQGKSIEMKYEMGMEMDWVIDEVGADGVISLTQRFTRFRISMESTDVDPIVFDSNEADRTTGYAYDLSKTLKPLLNADINVQLSSRGEIMNVTIPIETMDAIREAPGSMDLRQLLTKEGISETLSGSLTVLPEEAIESGGQWRAARTSQITGGDLDQKQTYTYAGVEDVEGTPFHKIDVETELNFRQPEDAVKQSQRITEQTHSGQIWFDEETKMFAGSEFSSELTTETPYRDALIETVSTATFTLKITAQNDQ